jgi:perosamine synthetase
MRKDKRYWHEEVGFNYRLTNLQAAVGLAQLERLAEFVEIKRRHAALYRTWLSDLDLELPGEQPWAKSVFWMVNILLGPSCRCDRDELARALAEQQIESRPVFYPLHQMPPYRAFVRPGQSFPCATDLARRGLSLPSATTLSAEQIERVCTVLHQTISA